MINVTLPDGRVLSFRDSGSRIRPVDLEPGDCFSFEGETDICEYLGNFYYVDLSDTMETFLIENPLKRVKLMEEME